MRCGGIGLEEVGEFKKAGIASDAVNERNISWGLEFYAEEIELGVCVIPNGFGA